MFKKKKDIVKFIDDTKDKMLDEQFQDRILREHYGADAQRETHARRLSKKAVAVAVLSCVLIVAIVLPCVLYFTGRSEPPTPPSTSVPSDPEDPDKSEPDEPIYTWQDEETTESTTEQVNKYLEGYELNAACVTDVVAAIDKDSGDDFYFVIAWQEESGRQGRIYIVVNKLYDDSLWDAPTDKEMSVNGLSVSYAESAETYPDYGLYVHSVYAKTKIGDIPVYFEEYIEPSFSEENTFSQFVEYIFIKK